MAFPIGGCGSSFRLTRQLRTWTSITQECNNISNIERILWLPLSEAAAAHVASCVTCVKIAENTHQCGAIIRFSIREYVTLLLNTRTRASHVHLRILGMCTHIMYITYLLLQCDTRAINEPSTINNTHNKQIIINSNIPMHIIDFIPFLS